MKKLLILGALICLLGESKAQNYISYYLIHVGVDHSLKENKRQKDIKENQGIVGVGEELNRASMSKFNQQYKKVKERLNSLGLLFDGAFMAAEAYPTLNSIVKTQGDILNEVQDMPLMIPVALESEREFVKKARSIILFLTGLVLTYGDINQMKAGDRKMLLNHALDELYTLDAISSQLLITLQNIKFAQSLNAASFDSWVNRDKEIINDIINNAKDLM